MTPLTDKINHLRR